MQQLEVGHFLTLGPLEGVSEALFCYSFFLRFWMLWSEVADFGPLLVLIFALNLDMTYVNIVYC